WGLIGHGTRTSCGADRPQIPASGSENAIRDSQLNAASKPKISMIITTTNARTVIEYTTSSVRVGTTTFPSSARTWRMNRPMARNGFFDPEPGASPLVGADEAFWLEFTSGLSDLIEVIRIRPGEPDRIGRADRARTCNLRFWRP